MLSSLLIPQRFADTGVVANTAYKNTATLSYGDTHTTVESSTTSKTFKMDVYKYTMVEDNKQGLGEAEFVLYKGSIEDGTVQYAIASEAVNDVYTITGWTEKGSETGRLRSSLLRMVNLPFSVLMLTSII